MKLIYTPAGSAAEEYDLDSFSYREMRALVDAVRTVRPEDEAIVYEDVEQLLRDQEPDALAAALWTMRRRTDESLVWDGFDVPGMKKLRAAMTDTEVSEFWDIVLERKVGEDETNRMRSLLRLRAEHPEFARKVCAGTAPKAVTGRRG